MAIRPAVVADAPALARVFFDARRAALPGVREAHGEAAVALWLARVVVAPGHRAWVAEEDDAPVGYLAMAEEGGEDGEAVALHLYLSPGAWRRRVGSRLLDAAKAESGGRLSLWCLARNAPALAFYARHGFRVVRGTDGAASEEGEPDVLLAWRAPAPARGRS